MSLKTIQTMKPPKTEIGLTLCQRKIIIGNRKSYKFNDVKNIFIKDTVPNQYEIF